MANSDAAELTTAVNLANNIHEIMVGLPTFDPANPTTLVQAGHAGDLQRRHRFQRRHLFARPWT